MDLYILKSSHYRQNVRYTMGNQLSHLAPERSPLSDVHAPKERSRKLGNFCMEPWAVRAEAAITQSDSTQGFESTPPSQEPSNTANVSRPEKICLSCKRCIWGRQR